MMKKEKLNINYGSLWNSLMILSNILGYEAEFNQINKLDIPEYILVDQLMNAKDVFIKA